MEKKNKVFIATSIDGLIADENGGIDWLHSIPNPDNNDMGFEAFTFGIDAIIMGRNTFETVCNFDIEWPYQKPVFVLSNKLTSLDKKFDDKVELINGSLNEVLEKIHNKGYLRLCIDGGKTIQGFLKENLIDEMTITIIPILLGGGIPLFTEFSSRINFECVDSKIFLEKVVQNHFVKINNEL